MKRRLALLSEHLEQARRDVERLMRMMSCFFWKRLVHEFYRLKVLITYETFEYVGENFDG